MRKRKKYFKVIRFYIDQAEYDKIIKNLSTTTCRSLSEYVRAIITRGPVTIYYRNKSYDEFLDVGIQFRKQLGTLLSANLLTESEKERLFHDIKIVKDLMSKLYDHVRQNNTDNKYSTNAAL